MDRSVYLVVGTKRRCKLNRHRRYGANMKESMDKRAFLKYLAAVLLFGLNGIVASGIALNSYEIVLLRTLIGTLAMAALFFLGRHRLTFYREKRAFGYLAASGLIMGIHWMLLYEAYQQVGVGIATLLCYCGPVLVMALSPLLFSERLTAWKLLGFAAVLAGVFLLSWEPRSGEVNRFGILCGILSAVGYAGMIICNKKAARIRGLENSMLQLLFAFIAVAIFVGLRQGLRFEISAGSWPYILMLGLVNTGIGCYCYFSSIGRLPVQTVSVLGYLEPVAAVVFSLLLLQEEMDAAELLGAALIIGGAAFAELYAGKQKKP